MNTLALLAKHRVAVDAPAISSSQDDDDRVRHHAGHGAFVGGAVGGLIGIVAALLAGMGSTLTLPGMISIAHDPVAVAAIGAAAGLLNGALAGMLVGWGIPRDAD